MKPIKAVLFRYGSRKYGTNALYRAQVILILKNPNPSSHVFFMKDEPPFQQATTLDGISLLLHVVEAFSK